MGGESDKISTIHCQEKKSPLTKILVDKKKKQHFLEKDSNLFPSRNHRPPHTTTMPPSQLKRLKSSLREQGIIGPQQSKKQKRKLAQDAKASNEKRLRRTEALGEIRDQFNPFQFKHNPRGPKFQVTTIKPANDKGIKGRPGVSKAISEERV